MVMRDVTLRIIAIFAWIGIIAGFLYSGRLMRSFAQRKTINIFMWSGVIDPKVFQQFEQETGIHVNVSYAEGNEELLVKLLATKAKGYDMVVPSDYVVQFLIKHNLLQKIDHSKLDFWNAINPHFLGRYYDPKNEYSVPSEWYIEGLGINVDFFDGKELPEASWATIFDPEKSPRYLGLLNDSREMVALGVKYLYGEMRAINDQEVEEVKQLLRKQKENVEAYTDFRGDFLLESGNCSVVMVASSYMWRIMRTNKKIKFLIPREGTLLNVENYVIPKPSKKAELVYKFWNFLFRLDIQKHNFENGVFLSTRKDADFMFNTDVLKTSTQLVHPDVTQRAEIFENKITDEQINEIWLAVKGS